jgi:uncharacterized protein (DUF302 family)
MTQAIDSFDKTVAHAIETLQAQGFGMMANTDVETATKNKPDGERRSYRILGPSAPPLAHPARTADPSIVMLLPYNVFVREEADGHITVGLMNPVAVLRLTGDLKNGESAQEVRGRLVQVCNKLAVARTDGTYTESAATRRLAPEVHSDDVRTSRAHPSVSTVRTTHQSRQPDNRHDSTADQQPYRLVGGRVGEKSGNVGAE